jgi:hypothetical protein
MDLIEKALAAKRESKHIEFKQGFDPSSAGEWCELIKDLVAIANSGGGIIVFGLNSFGSATGQVNDAISSIDPADITNKVSKYTGPIDLEFEILTLNKQKHPLVAFVIHPVSIPLVFEKPGTYDIGNGKQKTTFSVGTVYFRHGAKSEPGNSEDIRKVIDRQLEQIRRSWIKNVRKVVQAPEGAQIAIVQPRGRDAHIVLGSTVRAVNDPNAIPVHLTRDPSVASGSFIHEEVSNAIFDEINNVIDANRVLAKGQKVFLLGQPVYYRIYAERHHVRQTEETLSLLLDCGIADFYAPALYWAVMLPKNYIANTLANLYLYPTNRHVHYLMRIGLLLGPEFCNWLWGKWYDKWHEYPQPPSFYWTFQKMIAQSAKTDSRLLAARMSTSTSFTFGTENFTVGKDLIDKPEQAAYVVSNACMKIFEGDDKHRSLARNLDYLAYGPELQRHGSSIAKDVMRIVGKRQAGDVEQATEPED